ncbi:hypothetical protein ARMSODRAFT_884248, partial [Armillaria solidipes]
VFHDESCVHANDQCNFVWMWKGEQPLQNKSHGCIIHISDFIIEHCGKLALSKEEIAQQEKLLPHPSQTQRIIYPDAGGASWWDMPQLIEQTKDTIKIFDVKYLKGVTIFIFDCSSTYEAFASDVLLTHKMN